MDTTQINVEGYKFNMITHKDLVVAALNNGTKWEQTTLKLWTEKVNSTEGVILDVGAYTGIYGLLASAIDSSRRVECYEPLPQVFERLAANKNKNPSFNNMHLKKIALSDDPGTDEISITNPIPLPSGSSFHPNKKVSHVVKIKKECGDNIVRQGVGLIKIDTEHHEEHVLRGLLLTITQSMPVCIIEILDMDMLSRICQFMKDQGYNSIKHINDVNGELKDITHKENHELEDYNGGMNYIFELI